MPPVPSTIHRLLASDEPAAFRVEREGGRSPFLLTCDHAGALVPRKLNSLGLPREELRRHVAWDIGAGAVATKLAARLDAFVILQNYSRLVIDCNRPPGTVESIVRLSEATAIPGNESVSAVDALAREREVFRPYHERIRIELDARKAQHRCTILIAMHSFVPSFLGYERPWHAGLLYNRDSRLADVLLPFLREDSNLTIGVNQPYSVDDETDYAIPEYGERRGLLHVGIELRQDLIAEEAGQDRWAELLAHALTSASDIVNRTQSLPSLPSGRDAR
jgi:predicted N-formylglutamate amidohydrolase